MLKRAVNLSRRARELRARRLPQFRVAARRSPPTIYYVAPDLVRPSGGVRVIYRHVDVLNQLGFAALVMHRERGFACSWFQHDTAVVAGADAVLTQDDILVVPEWYGPALSQLRQDGPRLVIFNQRAYDTYDYVPFVESRKGAPYVPLNRLVSLLAVSHDNVDFLSYAFPDIPVALARNVIDSSVFHPGQLERGRQIAVVPAKRPHELERLQHILRARGILDRWTVAPISGQSEQGTAAIMRNSPLFVSLSDREGFGLPPAEAMASGCFVVGYPGLAGREFFEPGITSPIADGDLLGLARGVEDACTRYERSPEEVGRLGGLAAEYVRRTYHLDGLKDDLEKFYAPLMP